MKRVDLSRSARSDFLSIDLQTIHLFGFEQSIRLAAEFEEALQALAANPFLGHERSDLSPAGRSFRYWVVQKRFVIVYEPHVESIDVTGVGRRPRSALSTR